MKSNSPMKESSFDNIQNNNNTTKEAKDNQIKNHSKSNSLNYSQYKLTEKNHEEVLNNENINEKEEHGDYENNQNKDNNKNKDNRENQDILNSNINNPDNKDLNYDYNQDYSSTIDQKGVNTESQNYKQNENNKDSNATNTNTTLGKEYNYNKSIIENFGNINLDIDMIKQKINCLESKLSKYLNIILL